MKQAAKAVACVAAVATAGATTPPSTSTSSKQSSSAFVIIPNKNVASVQVENTHKFKNGITPSAISSIRGGDAHSEEEPPTTVPTDKEKPTRKKKKHSKRNKKEKNGEQHEDHSTAKDDSAKDSHKGKHHQQKDDSPHHPHNLHKAHQDRVVNEILNSDDYYDILGVTKTCTSAQIQKAYRRRCVLTHPDKMASGDRKAFDKVAEAYEVLNDESKRNIYNRYGKAGVDTGAGGGGAASSFSQEIFRSFFGGDPSQRRYQPRNRTVRYQLEVSLEDLYKGVTRTVIVTEPGGSSSSQGRKRVEVHVERGMASGQSITLSGEMDSVRDATPADLVFLLAQRPHPIFTRKGHDLAIELTIGLQEAICGVCEHSIQHLDGRRITFSSARRRGRGDAQGEPMMIRTGDIHVLKGEGMPKRHGVGGGHHYDIESNHEENHDENHFGDLYVQYRVEMPSAEAVDNLSTEERDDLGRLLAKLDGGPAPKKPNDEDRNGVKVLQQATSSDFGRASGPFRTDDPHDPHLGDEEEHKRSSFPFGTRQFQYFSGSPFGFGSDDFAGDNDGENVECQQM